MKFYFIDDDKNIRNILKLIITERNLGTVCGMADNGRDGLEDIAALKPDIVLVDLLMSEMDGISLVERLRETGSGSAFVMLSKVTDKEMIGNAYEAGVEFFIHKPVNIAEVEKVLNNVAEKIKMKRIMENLRELFGEDGNEKGSDEEASASDELQSLDMIFNMLGMLGEKGTREIRDVYACMRDCGCGYDKVILSRVAEERGDSVKNLEQRIRRAMKKGLTNVASAALADYESEVFQIYGNYVFDFKSVRDEMDFLEGKSKSGGRVSISHFMEGLILYGNSIR
ncbi:MAG: DNA-binding domain-containing protein [Victivallaceae bacterium]